MNYQLLPLIPTVVIPHKKAAMRVNKWRIADEDGVAITTIQGRGVGYGYKEHPEEVTMLHTLRKEFRGYEIISTPDPHQPTHCLYEARQLVPLAVAEIELTPELVTPAATTGELTF